MLVLTTSAFQGPVKGWYDHVVDEWFNHENGQFSYVVDGNPDSGLDDNELPDVVLPGGDGDFGDDDYYDDDRPWIPPPPEQPTVGGDESFPDCWCGIPGCDGCHNEPGGTDH